MVTNTEEKCRECIVDLYEQISFICNIISILEANSKYCKVGKIYPLLFSYKKLIPFLP